MSYEDWLYRKLDQNAHNEILAFLMVVLGINLLLGGMTMTTIAVGEPSVMFFLTGQPITSSTALGLILTVTGLLVAIAGFVLVIHYDRQKSWYASEIEKSSLHTKRKVSTKTIHQIMKEYSDKTEQS